MLDTRQVVLITGASSGFGRLIAETLARENYRVFATMRDVKGRNAGAAREIAELAQRESLSLQTLELDVTKDFSVESAVSKTVLQCGRVDVLEQSVMALGAVHLQVQQALGDRVLEVLRAAGDVAERVHPLDGVADDVESVAHAFAASRMALMMLS